ncbi:MAG: glycerol kinase GlpK [Anaerolineae bacterium]|nr:glycerol kinase GlpK [Anaerolineae bacterium]MDW8099147.1 glycerol kinase GlpK [Anaerolineae bacterium]
MALDQGTTSSRAIVFDDRGRVIAVAQREFRQIYPQPGWVEHDPEEIWATQLAVAREALARASLQAGDLAGIGITNQRETTIAWDRQTGQPIHNAIVWQCRRTAAMCDMLRARGLAETVRQKTGLVIDAYFSGTKIAWLLEHVPGARQRAERGELAFGTVDTWLIWRLTGGRVHATDYSNASRTMIFNIHTLDWDEELLQELRIPRAMLPEVRPSAGIFGESTADVLGEAVPIAGVAGDQQAATFGQACFAPGMAKNTYGTGCFLLLNTGERAVPSQRGLLTTIAWGLNGRVTYALEGSIFIAGAAIQWLRDGLGIITNASETETLAGSVRDTGGVYFVPAFVGLGAPYWDAYARGTIVGLTRGTGRPHLVRAALEAICYQTRDVMDAMTADAGVPLHTLRVDGGAVANNLLCQLQADLLGVPVQRPVVTETTALGVAYLAGLAVGVWESQEEIAAQWQVDREFHPQMPASERDRLYAGWQRAVERARGWATA